MGIWDGDRLGRSRDAKWLADFLRRRSKELSDRGEKRAYVLNIDARWGDGKTFFMKRFRDELAQAHIAVYVDAWRDDFADDPLTAVMAAIDEVVAQRTKKPLVKKTFEELKGKVGTLTKLAAQGIGLRLLSMGVTAGIAAAMAEAVTTTSANDEENVEERAEKVGGEVHKAFEGVLEKGQQGAVDAFVEMRKNIRQFSDKLAEFVLQVEQNEDLKGPLFILIDELDRCRPPYAIAMLERVKHIFETPNVVFVFATNSKELCHSINAIYGAGFDSRHYLNRFFDRTYTFEPTLPAQFIDNLLADYPIDSSKLTVQGGQTNQVIRDFFLATDLDLRSIGQIYDTLRVIAEDWQEKAPLDPILLLPLILAYHKDRANLEGDQATLFISNLPAKWSLKTHWGGARADVPYKDIADQLLRLATRYTLPAAMNQSTRGAAYDEVRSIFDREMRLQHNGRWQTNSEPKSVMANYPTLVRRAGRMTFPEVANDEEDDASA
jgi:hypothetical protein